MKNDRGALGLLTENYSSTIALVGSGMAVERSLCARNFGLICMTSGNRRVTNRTLCIIPRVSGGLPVAEDALRARPNTEIDPDA